MDKKIITIFFLIAFSSFVLAESLEPVVIPSEVVLNENLIISGFFNGDSIDGNILCSFRIFDVYEDNRLIWRLSDEYTSADGFVNNSPFKITEPLFQRGKDYNAVICCSVSCADQNFQVMQKEDYIAGYNYNSLFYDILYFKNTDVILPIVLVIFVLFVIGWKIFLQK